MDNETKRNEKLTQYPGYHLYLNGKLLGTNRTYHGAQRTASNMGPGVVIVAAVLARKRKENFRGAPLRWY